MSSHRHKRSGDFELRMVELSCDPTVMDEQNSEHRMRRSLKSTLKRGPSILGEHFHTGIVKGNQKNIFRVVGTEKHCVSSTVLIR